MAQLTDDDVLLLWRALNRFRSGRAAACAPRGRPTHSNCPLSADCPRWNEPDDLVQSYDETLEQTERRRARWPCSRLLDALAPGVTRIG